MASSEAQTGHWAFFAFPPCLLARVSLSAETYMTTGKSGVILKINGLYYSSYYDILEKAELQRQQKDQRFPGAGERTKHIGFLGQ